MFDCMCDTQKKFLLRHYSHSRTEDVRNGQLIILSGVVFVKIAVYISYILPRTFQRYKGLRARGELRVCTDLRAKL